MLEAIVHMPENADVKRRDLTVFGQPAACYVLDGMVSAEHWQRFILQPCLTAERPRGALPLADALEAILPVGEMSRVTDVREAAQALMNGQAVLLCQGMPCALCLDILAFVRRGITPPLSESVVLGPHQGFNESIRDNLTLLRRILPTPELITQLRTIGDSIPVGLAMVYLEGIADHDTLRAIRQRLDGIRIDHVLSVGMLQQLLEDDPGALVPQACLTERPDRAASFLLEGQVMLLLDGSPQALCMPVSLLHLLHTPDDSSMRWQAGTFVRLIRMLGACCTLLLPGLFVALITYQPQMLPVTLLTAILESQASIPLSIAA